MHAALLWSLRSETGGGAASQRAAVDEVWLQGDVQHLVKSRKQYQAQHKVRRIPETEGPAVASSPMLQFDQRSETGCVHRFDARQVYYQLVLRPGFDNATQGLDLQAEYDASVAI